MRKTEFVQIATILNDAYRATRVQDNIDVLKIDSIFLHQAKSLSKILSKTNPKFDFEKFLTIAMK